MHGTCEDRLTELAEDLESTLASLRDLIGNANRLAELERIAESLASIAADLKVECIQLAAKPRPK